VQAAATESRDQLRQRIEQAQQDTKNAQQRAQQRAEQTADRARGKFAQMKADAAAVEQSGSLERLRPRRCGAAVVEDFARPLVVKQVATPAARQGRDGRPDRDLGALSHRHPRRPRRLAGRAVAAVHSLPNDPRGIP
jgi:hypothetical protein